MPLPRVEISSLNLSEIDCDTVVVALTPGSDAPVIADPSLSADDHSYLVVSAEALGVKTEN